MSARLSRTMVTELRQIAQRGGTLRDMVNYVSDQIDADSPYAPVILRGLMLDGLIFAFDLELIQAKTILKWDLFGGKLCETEVETRMEPLLERARRGDVSGFWEDM